MINDLIENFKCLKYEDYTYYYIYTCSYFSKSTISFQIVQKNYQDLEFEDYEIREILLQHTLDLLFKNIQKIFNNGLVL